MSTKRLVKNPSRAFTKRELTQRRKDAKAQRPPSKQRPRKIFVLYDAGGAAFWTDDFEFAVEWAAQYQLRQYQPLDEMLPQ